jgi:2-C-methyl-D-erythritol 4-phosphate cytidylyltransferase
MITGILLAGGKGERIKSTGVPKQFYKIGGKPLIAFALSEMGKCAEIDVICIVSLREKYEEIKGIADGLKITQKIIFAEAGKSRQHSVLSGLLSLEKEIFSPDFSVESKVTSTDSDLVIVHDAARPLVKSADFSACIEAAKGYHGATPALTPSDTVYLSENGETVTSLLLRDKLFAGQTPECYNFRKYLEAFRKLTDDEIMTIRGGSEIAFLSGMNIHLFPGNSFNIKITTERDLEFFKFIVEKEGLL